MLLIHLGYHRTGSSFLQRFLEKDSSINYLGSRCYDTKPKIQDEELFKISKNNTYSNINNGLSDFKKIYGNKIFSDEKYNYFSSERYLNYVNNSNFLPIKILHDAYKEKTNFNVKIFFLIRDHYEMIKSCWFQFYATWYYNFKKIDFDDIFSIIENNKLGENNELRFFLESLDYLKKKSQLDQIFGYENVKAFFFEGIFEEKFEQGNFLNFLNIKTNFFENSKKINSSLKDKNIIHTKFSAFIKKNNLINKNLHLISPKIKLFLGRKKYTISEDKEIRYKKILENYYGYNYTDLKKNL